MLDSGAEMVVGIDVGGTFTDVTVYEPSSGQVRTYKSPSDSAHPEKGVLDGLDKARLDYGSCRLMVHGTTVGTNALLQRRGAKAAMVTTAGFRDVIELGRTTRMVPHTLYDPYFRRPAPFVPRRRRFTVPERTSTDGEVERIPSDDDLAPLIERLDRAGAESVAVCFLNSYANDETETRIVDALRDRFEFVTGSADVSNEVREYERFSTCVVNAYLMPVMSRYAGDLVDSLRERGYENAFHTMASNGGLLTEDLVRRYPVRTVLSGPAAGVSAAAYLAQARGLKNYITYDMGGTSSDVALVADGSWPVKRETILDGIMIRVPQLDIQTVGAGGGSIARIDSGGGLFVGPESAGADPGPASYGRGGTEPTVTDANAVLGRLGANQELGGSLRLDADAARKAVGMLGDRIGKSAEEMAEGIVRVAVTKMAAAIYEISIGRGHDPRDFSLLSFGGAGPLHAGQIAAELGIDSVVVPPAPGVFSAYGGLCSALFREVMETALVPLTETSLDVLERQASAFGDRLSAEFEDEGADAACLRFHRELDARYLGQAHEITISFPVDATLERITGLFEEEYEREFGRLDRQKSIEIVNLRVRGELPVEPPALSARDLADGTAIAKYERDMFVGGEWRRCAVYEREDILPGAAVDGPAIIEEMSTTVYVPPGWRARTERYGELVMRQDQSSLEEDPNAR